MHETVTDRSAVLAGGIQPTGMERFPYAIRRHVDDDDSDVLGLLRQTVGETSASRKTAAFWRWKHRDNPFGRSYSACVWDGKQLVGLRTLMWWTLRDAAGRTHRAARAVDTATHPAYQRRGIFSASTRFAIGELTAQDASFIFNTPNRNSLPGYLKLGWQVVARWPLFMRPTRLVRTGWRIGRRFLPNGSRSASRAAGATSAWIAWSDFRRQASGFESLIAAHEAGRRTVGYRTVRSAAYLDWRYGAHPDVEYRVHAAEGPAGVDGLVIGRIVDGAAGLRALLIVDLLLRSPTVRAGASLLRTAVRASTADYAVTHFSAGTVERRALTWAGFVPALDRGYTFVARPLGAAEPDPTDARSWDLTLGELEIF